jgi:hypothetical protein
LQQDLYGGCDLSAKSELKKHSICRHNTNNVQKHDLYASIEEPQVHMFVSETYSSADQNDQKCFVKVNNVQNMTDSSMKEAEKAQISSGT